MCSPFLLFDNGDVSLFRTIESLAAYVESPDVEKYLATDSSGRIVRLEASTQSHTSKIGIVSVQPVKATQTMEVVDIDKFRRLLLHFLHQIAEEVDESSPVQQLILVIEKRVGFTE